jgi:hypothetical protein
MRIAVLLAPDDPPTTLGLAGAIVRYLQDPFLHAQLCGTPVRWLRRSPKGLICSS